MTREELLKLHLKDDLKELLNSISCGKKVYKALLTQVGTNVPIATVLENTLGNIVFSRTATGFYKATLTGAFIAGKTFIPRILDADIMAARDNQLIEAYRGDDNFIYINSSVIATQQGIDGVITQTPILIEVYD